MTEEDAENMTVEDERLADILGLAEEPAGDAPRGCRMQETPKSGGQGATQPRGDGGGSDAGGLGVGRAPRYAPPDRSGCLPPLLVIYLPAIVWCSGDARTLGLRLLTITNDHSNLQPTILPKPAC